MFATAGDAVEAMRGQLQTLAGARARANMFVDESDLVHHFRMQESKAGHVSRADFAKVLVQVFPTLPLAASPAALDELASQFAVDSTTMPQGQQQLVPFHMFVYVTAPQHSQTAVRAQQVSHHEAGIETLSI